VAGGRPDPIFPVGFDSDALAEDLDRLPASAEIALRAFRKELRRAGGIPQSRLMACQAEGRDGTRLGGCVKTYIPWPDGRFGAIFVPARHPTHALRLRAFAFGVRHHPRESNAETVYKIAHRRLGGHAE
jgi:hypothetical protein